MGVMDGGGDPQELRGRGTRFRNDNFVESASGSGWLGIIDADIEVPINFPQFRFRYCCTNESGAESNRSIGLRYSLNAGAYLAVNPSSSVVKVVDTLHYADKDDSTDFGDANDLYTASWADDTNGYLIDDSGVTGQANYPAPVRRLESEWSVALVPADLSVGNTIHFRGYSAGVPFNQGYDATPKITVAAIAAHPEPWFVHRNRAVLSRIVTR